MVFKAVKRARSGNGASFIEAKTLRLGGHLVHDPQRYRPKEEIEAAWEQCPVKLFNRRLQVEGLMTAEDYKEMEAEVDREVKAAVEFARQSPPPETAEAFEDLWV